MNHPIRSIASRANMKRIKRSDIPDEEILEAIRAWRREHRAGRPAQTPDQSLAHKYPVKVIMAKMEQMENRGIIESGVSLRTAWIVGE